DGALAPGAQGDRHAPRGRATDAAAGDPAAALGRGPLTGRVLRADFFWFTAPQGVSVGGGHRREEGGAAEAGFFHAGSRPPSTRASASVSSAAAVPQVIADTAGSPKSVPLSTACRKTVANATYVRRCTHSHTALRMRRFR